jgi:hypothetical protein
MAILFELSLSFFSFGGPVVSNCRVRSALPKVLIYHHKTAFMRTLALIAAVCVASAMAGDPWLSSPPWWMGGTWRMGGTPCIRLRFRFLRVGRVVTSTGV